MDRDDPTQVVSGIEESHSRKSDDILVPHASSLDATVFENDKSNNNNEKMDDKMIAIQKQKSSQIYTISSSDEDDGVELKEQRHQSEIISGDENEQNSS